MTRHDGNAGYTLVEALMSLMLAGLLLCLLGGVLVSVGRLAREHARLSASADTERVVAAVLDPELRYLTGADVSFGADSVRVRAFRGGGIVCAEEPDGLIVRYTGIRLPDDSGDSMLVLGTERESSIGLERPSIRAACPGSTRANGVRIPLPKPVVGAVYVMVFESGAYSIGGSAFRYRLGRAGRQPLTDQNLVDARSGWSPAALDEGAVALRVALAGAASDTATRWTIVMPQGRLRPVAFVP